MTAVACCLALVALLVGACSTTPGPDAGLAPPAATKTVHVAPTGCTVIVIDRADGTEQDLCLTASDLQPIVDARTKAGMH